MLRRTQNGRALPILCIPIHCLRESLELCRRFKWLILLRGNVVKMWKKKMAGTRVD